MIYYNQTANTFTVPTGDYLAMGIFMVSFFMIMLVFMFLFLRTQRLLDRYRLKYSFDKEIEQKEGAETEHKMNNRERLFKRRTFKD